MRLIDADALWEALCRDEAIEDAYGSGVLEIVSDILDDMLGEAPTVDAVPVVRCRDCKYFAGEFMYCAFNIIVPFDYFFCLHGRREADDETD